MANVDAIAAAYCAQEPSRVPIAQHYLRENLVFRLTPGALEGLRTYYAEAARAGVVEPPRDPSFFDDGQSAIMGGHAGQPDR
jgi:hypothetical protein